MTYWLIDVHAMLLDGIVLYVLLGGAIGLLAMMATATGIDDGDRSG